MLPFRDVPIIINSFNRVSCMRRLIDWLEGAGYRNIIVLDNESTYPPLLEYLQHLEQGGKVRVVRLGGNFGHKGLWEQGLLDRLGITSEYVYTDPDVIPCDFCPPDVVAVLQEVLASESAVNKAGLGLRLDDIPDTYKFKQVVTQWENRWWLHPVASNLFLTHIDTTFALYRRDSVHNLDRPALRTGWPYLASHDGWYINSDNPSPEDVFYSHTASRDVSTQSVSDVPDWLKAEAKRFSDNKPMLLHIGCGRQIIPGYVNIDRGEGVDIDFDLNQCRENSLPIEDDTVDGIYGCNTFQHIEDTYALMDELYRVAKNNAKFVLRVPYGASNDAFADPRNVRPYFEKSFVCFSQPAHYNSPLKYSADWDVEKLILVVAPHLRALPEANIHEVIPFGRNAVTEMIVHLRAVKPARPRRPDLIRKTKADVSLSRLDPYSGFVRV